VFKLSNIDLNSDGSVMSLEISFDLIVVGILLIIVVLGLGQIISKYIIKSWTK